jgi:hypothetical protein
MKLYLHDNSNFISMNSLTTIIANAMEKSKLGEASFDEHDIFSPPSIEEKIYFDDTIPSIYDDYNDEYDIFSPPTIEEKINYDSFMHVAHDRNVLGDSYIVNFIHDAAEIYYERGKHGFMHLNNIKFPLLMLKILKLNLFCFPMLVALYFHDLFLYKILVHRKWVRLKNVSYLLFYALFCFKLFSDAYASIF